MNNILLDKKDFDDFTLILRRYVNLKKVVYFIDKALAEEFSNKQQAFFSKLHSSHDHGSGGCCGESELNHKIFIPKENMNNLEKVLLEIYEKFYYEDNILRLVTYLNEKYVSITTKAKRDGMTMAVDDEREFLHNLLKEGVNFYLCSKLRNKLREFEESVSSQPMLLANPGSIDKDQRIELLNKLPSSIISNLLKNSIVKLEKNIYDNINEYELYNEFKYLYLEGRYESISLDYLNCFSFKFHKDFFKNTKFLNIDKLAKQLNYLPYELNMKYQEFSLQVNDYSQLMYFKSDLPHKLEYSLESSLDPKYDTGKKLTLVFVLFPYEVKLSDRKIIIQYKEVGSQEEREITLDSSMQGFISKSRLITYKIKSIPCDFALVFYYLHGPIDNNLKL